MFPRAADAADAEPRILASRTAPAHFPQPPLSCFSAAKQRELVAMRLVSLCPENCREPDNKSGRADGRAPLGEDHFTSGPRAPAAWRSPLSSTHFFDMPRSR